MKCGKCHGKGFIDGFAHVSEGICFKCKGTGVVPEPKKGSITFSRQFIEEYRGASYFPEDQEGFEKIISLKYEGHPTAEKMIMKDAEFYYIGQPICRSSDWFKVPVQYFDEFYSHYKKCYKLENTLTLTL